MFATCAAVPDKAKAPHAYRWYIHIAAIKGVRRYEAHLFGLVLLDAGRRFVLPHVAQLAAPPSFACGMRGG